MPIRHRLYPYTRYWFQFNLSVTYALCAFKLPRGVMGLSAVCDCGISLSYSLTIFHTSLIESQNADFREPCIFKYRVSC